MVAEQPPREVSGVSAGAGYRYLGSVSGEQVTQFWGKVVSGAAKRRQIFQKEQAKKAEKYRDFRVR